jgi:hypothetical protein
MDDEEVKERGTLLSSFPLCLRVGIQEKSQPRMEGIALRQKKY